MKTLLEHMQAHHGRCDQLYADGENFLLDEKIEEGLESIKSFLNEMERHFQMEETVLFPTFEEISYASGANPGDANGTSADAKTSGKMSESVSNGDPEEILEVCETMMILMQQHNVKEEGILYPMAD